MSYILAVSASGIDTAPLTTLEEKLRRSYQGGKESIISAPYQGKYYVFIDQISTMYTFQGVLRRMLVTNEQVRGVPAGFVEMIKTASQAPVSRNREWVGDAKADAAINTWLQRMFERTTR